MAAFVVVPQLLPAGRLQVAAVYSWLASRYLLAVLLVAVALRCPRLSIRAWLVAILAMLEASLIVFGFTAPWFPDVFAAGSDGAIVISDTVLLDLVPSVLPTGC